MAANPVVTEMFHAEAAAEEATLPAATPPTAAAVRDADDSEEPGNLPHLPNGAMAPLSETSASIQVISSCDAEVGHMMAAEALLLLVSSSKCICMFPIVIAACLGVLQHVCLQFLHQPLRCILS